MLTRLIAHRIKKKAHATTAKLHLRDTVLPTNSELASNLLEQLRDSFQKRNPVSGKFRSTGDTEPRFQQLLKRYVGADDEEAFVAFSKDAMHVLRDEMVRQQAATGGYVVFAEFSADGTKFLLAALLGTTAKPSFDSELNLIETPSLDLDHLRHGARIRFDKVDHNDDGVVQFISQSTSGVSEYFTDFIGCEEISRPEEQGRHLHTALDAWATQNNFTEEQRGQLLQKAYSYWQDCRREGQAMSLTGISNALNPQDPKKLLKHLGSESHQLAGEFSPPPPSIMKRFIKFAFNQKGLKLEFDRNLWQNEIEIDPATKTLTINNVPDELVTAFNEQA